MLVWQSDRRMDDRRRGALLILAAAALWGTTGTAQALGPETSDPLGVGLVRLLVAAPALVLLAVVLDREAVRTGWRAMPVGATVVAAAAMAAYQPAFFTAVDRTGVAMGTVVAIGSAPIITGVLAWFADGVRPLRVWWVATPLAVAGVALLAVTGAGGGVGVDPVGVLLAVGAGASYAAYVVASMRLVRHGSAVLAMAVVFVLAAVFLLPMLWFVDLGWLWSASGFGVAIHLGVVATAIAYALFATGLRSTPAATAATLTLGEPLTATLLGVVVLGERPEVTAWVGAGLIALGLFLTVTRRLPVSQAA